MERPSVSPVGGGWSFDGPLGHGVSLQKLVPGHPSMSVRMASSRRTLQLVSRAFREHKEII